MAFRDIKIPARTTATSPGALVARVAHAARAPRLVSVLVGVLVCGSVTPVEAHDAAEATLVAADGADAPAHVGGLLAGSLVATPDGPRPVEALHEGDLVQSVDVPEPRAGDAPTRERVVATMHHETTTLVHVVTDHARTDTTPDHPFLFSNATN